MNVSLPVIPANLPSFSPSPAYLQSMSRFRPLQRGTSAPELHNSIPSSSLERRFISVGNLYDYIVTSPLSQTINKLKIKKNKKKRGRFHTMPSLPVKEVAHGISVLSEKIFQLELEREKTVVKREERINGLLRLGIPFTRTQLEKVIQYVDRLTHTLCENSNISYPALFRACVDLQAFELEVHSKKKIYLLHPNSKEFPGKFKKVIKVWNIAGKPESVAYLMPNPKNRDLESIRNAALNEIKFLTLLNGKVKTVKLLKAFEYDDKRIILVTKFYDKGDLFELITKNMLAKKRNEPPIVSDEQIIKLGLDILKEIKEMHKHNVIHKDIKPENILLDGDSIVVADFGYACKKDDKKSRKHSAGSLPYAAYEILMGNSKAFGTPLDAWGAACLLWVLLFNQPSPWQRILSSDNPDIFKAMGQIQKFHDPKNFDDKTNDMLTLLKNMLEINVESRLTVEEAYKRYKKIIEGSKDITNNLVIPNLPMSFQQVTPQNSPRKLSPHADSPLKNSPRKNPPKSTSPRKNFILSTSPRKNSSDNTDSPGKESPLNSPRANVEKKTIHPKLQKRGSLPKLQKRGSLRSFQKYTKSKFFTPSDLAPIREEHAVK